MDNFAQNIRFAVRLLIKNRGFTVVAILTLAIGIGANTAIFSLVNSVLLRPLPFKNPDQLVWIWSTRTDRDKTNFSLPDFMDYKVQNRTLSQISAFSAWSANLVNAGEPERLFGVRSSANVFQMLGVKAEIGRTLTKEDDNPANPRVVVLSHGFWARRFGGSADVVGKQLTLDDENYTVTGVLPADFTFPTIEADIVVPLRPDLDPLRNERASISYLRVIGRLNKGVSQQQAESDLTSIATQLKKLHPVANASKKGVKLIPLQEELVGNFRLAFIVLSAAVGLVLLIACANLANLALARASTRYREMAIRLAIGATRKRLIGQLFTENILLALMGGAAGIAFSRLAMKALIAMSPASLPRSGEIHIDATALLFTLLLSLLSGVLFGLMPALHISKDSFSEELKGSGKGASDSGRRSGVRNVLIVAEVALSLLLLIGAGLLTKSFLRLQAVSPGFDFNDLLVMRISLPKSQYSKPEKVGDFYEQLSGKIQNLPGVQSVSATSTLPLSGTNVRIPFTVVGRPPLSVADQPITQYRMTGPNYFRTMKIPIRSGRDFDTREAPGTQPVAIINETFARKYFDESRGSGRPCPAIGQHLMIDDNNTGPRDVEIIGVVGSIRHASLQADPAPEIYLTIPQIPEENVSLLTNNMSWVVRTSVEPLTLADGIRRELQSVDRNVPISNTKSMEQLISTSLGPSRFNLFLIGIFALVALSLAGMGIYAVISYSISQRTQELGLRMALGAQKMDVLRLVVSGGLKIVLIGIAIGLSSAYALTRVLSNMLFGISVTDPSTFLSMSLLFILISLFATYLPARRAAQVDPIITLRSE
jgi:putative ABC transport system permease protein